MTSPRTQEHRKAATRVGLNYVTDGVPGITRRRAGKGWAFYDPDGTRIADRDERNRIKVLVIPPAWTDVWICPDHRGHIQVTARDAKGRKQYRYHPQYREARDHSKFRHIFEFSEVLPAVREHAERDLRAPELSRRQVLATAVQLLEKTLIRIGSDEYARIVQRCQDLPGEELFQYLNESGKRETIASDDVNEYLQEISGNHITAKDFRTWGGTMLAGSELREMGPALTQRQATGNINKMIDTVAERLGNTRAVCRKYYIHPTLIEAYQRGLTAGPPAELSSVTDRRKRRGAALRRDEVAILQFLHDLV